MSKRSLERGLFVFSMVLFVNIVSCKGGDDNDPVDGDTTPPSITSITPMDSSINVPVDTNVVITFNEAMNVSSLFLDDFGSTNSTVSLEHGGMLVNGLASFDGENKILTINPYNELIDDTQYSLTINTAASDVAGNDLPSTFSSSFTTANSGYNEYITENTVVLTPFPVNASLVVSAQWSGESSDFGYPSNEVYALTIQGEDVLQTRITYSKKNRAHFAVSPNRRYLAEARYSHGDSDGNGKLNVADWKTLWIEDLSTGKETGFFTDQYDVVIGGVDWTPDSEKIVYAARKEPNGTMDVLVQDKSKSYLLNITDNLEIDGVPTYSGKWVSDVSVSYDGEWVAFVYRSTQDLNTSEHARIVICKIADCSSAKFITDGGPELPGVPLGPFGHGDFDPEWSPDGQYISFQRATNVGLVWGIPSHDIYKVQISDGSIKKLSPDENSTIHGISDWNASNQICFTVWSNSRTSPALINSDGTAFKLLDVPNTASHVRWIQSN